MLTCERVTLELLEAYGSAQISEAESDEVAAHLSACPACEQRFNDTLKIPGISEEELLAAVLRSEARNPSGYKIPRPQ